MRQIWPRRPPAFSLWAFNAPRGAVCACAALLLDLVLTPACLTDGGVRAGSTRLRLRVGYLYNANYTPSYVGGPVREIKMVEAIVDVQGPRCR